MRIAKWLGAAIGLFLVAGVVGFGALTLTGTASAQEPGAKLGRYQELLAQKLGISVGKLEEAQKAARDALVDEGVKNGTITPERGERVKKAQRGELRHGFGNMRMGVGHIANNVLEDAAAVIGIPVSELRQDLRAGKSLAQIASENGKSRDALKLGLEKALKEDIATAEKNGRITAEQADKLEAGVSARLDTLIDRSSGDAKGLRERFQGMPGGRNR